MQHIGTEPTNEGLCSRCPGCRAAWYVDGELYCQSCYEGKKCPCKKPRRGRSYNADQKKAVSRKLSKKLRDILFP